MCFLPIGGVALEGTVRSLRSQTEKISRDPSDLMMQCNADTINMLPAIHRTIAGLDFEAANRFSQLDVMLCYALLFDVLKVAACHSPILN